MNRTQRNAKNPLKLVGKQMSLQPTYEDPVLEEVLNTGAPNTGGGDLVAGILIGLFNKSLTFRMWVNLLTIPRSNANFSCLKTDSISRRSVSNPRPSRSPSRPGSAGSCARAAATPASPQASASRAPYRMSNSKEAISEASDTGALNRERSASVPSQRNDASPALPLGVTVVLDASQQITRTACIVAG